MVTISFLGTVLRSVINKKNILEWCQWSQVYLTWKQTCELSEPIFLLKEKNYYTRKAFLNKIDLLIRI